MFYVESDTTREPLQSGGYADALDEFKTLAATENAALVMTDDSHTAYAVWSGYQSEPYGQFVVLLDPKDYCEDNPYGHRKE